MALDRERTKACFITSSRHVPITVLFRKKDRDDDLFFAVAFRCILVCGGHSATPEYT